MRICFAGGHLQYEQRISSLNLMYPKQSQLLAKHLPRFILCGSTTFTFCCIVTGELNLKSNSER